VADVALPQLEAQRGSSLGASDVLCGRLVSGETGAMAAGERNGFEQFAVQGGFEPATLNVMPARRGDGARAASALLGV